MAHINEAFAAHRAALERHHDERRATQGELTVDDRRESTIGTSLIGAFKRGVAHVMNALAEGRTADELDGWYWDEFQPWCRYGDQAVPPPPVYPKDDHE